MFSPLSLSAGCPRLRPRRPEEDGPPLHLPAGVCSEAPAQRPAVQDGGSALQDRAQRAAGAGQGQEPLAQRGRPQRGAAAGETGFILHIHDHLLQVRTIKTLRRCARTVKYAQCRFTKCGFVSD